MMKIYEEMIGKDEVDMDLLDKHGFITSHHYNYSFALNQIFRLFKFSDAFRFHSLDLIEVVPAVVDFPAVSPLIDGSERFAEDVSKLFPFKGGSGYYFSRPDSRFIYYSGDSIHQSIEL
jgi:hypothetical protein